MHTFNYQFDVNAPLTAVTQFHSQTDILRQLTPPPIIVKIHSFGEMREGMVADFTMWFGPFPIHWQAEHINVSDHGFTDVQRQGLMAKWEHTHRFEQVEDNVTRLYEHIDYEYPTGWRGIVARLLFNKPGLYFLFFYRKLITRRFIA